MVKSHLKAGSQLLLAFGLCSTTISTQAAEGWFPGRSVSYLSGGDSRPCAFFTLEGVAQADPAQPNVGWFVLPKTHPQFKETYALLLVAKVTGRTVNVTTSGLIDACGHAQVISVGLP